jgi:hypothetical protein
MFCMKGPPERDSTCACTLVRACLWWCRGLATGGTGAKQDAEADPGKDEDDPEAVYDEVNLQDLEFDEVEEVCRFCAGSVLREGPRR